MGNEVTYDNASSAELISPKESSEGPQTILGGDTLDIGCHSNSTQLSALSNNKNAEILEKSFNKTLKFKPHLICTPECSNMITKDKNYLITNAP